MARPLLLIHHHLRNTTTTQAGFAAVAFLLYAFALFMCASHSRKWHRWKAYYGYHNHDPVIQLNSEGMIHGIQFNNGEGSAYNGGEVSVWQKNILMGGKCQLPDFSGVIIYDSTGNVAAPAKTSRALPWK
ncbi:uncharacterized protein LOC132273434 [Cornus florida]|uniref:uncharacterized protein LOC132273434 n=1 Tax=Cornus florida TaxID=4283 RepID=UPI00289908E6|nr:uncharacterized protein LOC132273434 [Cornus florida]